VPDVISDTSPIQYLYQIELLDLLFTLYEEITIPEAVANEFAEGRDHGVNLPGVEEMSRFKVRTSAYEQTGELPASLGRGERAVLALASVSPGSLLLLDDALARRHARKLGLRFTGTLGVLLKAKQSGLLTEVSSILDRLEAKGFRLDKKTRAAVLKLAQETQNKD
jgi:predicted nucleic acid-binding protein